MKTILERERERQRERENTATHDQLAFDTNHTHGRRTIDRAN